MTAIPPSRPSPTPRRPALPRIAWLLPLAGGLGVVGGALAWFRPRGTVTFEGKSLSRQVKQTVHSWDDGQVGVLGPVLLLIVGVVVLALLLGRAPARVREGSRSLTWLGPVAIGTGIVTIGVAALAWFRLESQYKFAEDGKTYSWDAYIAFAKQAGVTLTLSRGAQPGLWLTFAAGVLAIAGGALLLLRPPRPQRRPQPGWQDEPS
jgi:hypothetical protein